jgi:D-alanine-D-alanine ligase
VRIAVLRGGRSSEHDVSLRSGASVAAGLRAAGHEVVDVVLERDGRWRVGDDELELRAGGGLLGCDAAFPVLHGPFGEDGVVQGVLETLDLAYVGPGILAAATTIDKLTFKRLLRDRGLPQVDFCAAGEAGWRNRVATMGAPVWVKPSRLGSSVGISRVADPGDDAELDAAVETARRHDPRVIVEAHGDGREIECSVLGNEDPISSPPGEIVAHAEWYDFEAKYGAGGMELVVPARIPAEQADEVRRLAVEVFAACDCSGLARCDFFVAADRVLVNELNTIPGFTETSVYAKLLEAGGIPYPQLCERLVELALERRERQRGYEF